MAPIRRLCSRDSEWATVDPPALSKPRERPLDALSEGGPGKIGALPPGIRQQRVGIRRRQPRQRPPENLGKVACYRRLLRRLRRIRPLRKITGRLLPPAARSRPVGPDLPRRDPQDPRQRVAPGVELAGPA